MQVLGGEVEEGSDPGDLWGLPIAVAFGIGEAFDDDPRPPREARPPLDFGGLRTPLVLAAALVASVLVHADRATSRRLVTTEVSHLLGIVLGGRVQLERIGGIGLIGLDGVRARVFEPGGRQVLYVDGLRVRLSLFDLLESLFADTEDLTIALDSVEIAYADVELDGDAEGSSCSREPSRRAPTGPRAPRRPTAEVSCFRRASSRSPTRGRTERPRRRSSSTPMSTTFAAPSRCWATRSRCAWRGSSSRRGRCRGARIRAVTHPEPWWCPSRKRP
jgi:hypothetical protein